MIAGDLDYYIRKKLDTQYVRDTTQLAERVQQVEHLKAEKARSNKFHKKQKVAYIEANENEPQYAIGYQELGEIDFNVVELKSGPLYVCKLLKPFNGKNPVEPKNDKFVAKNLFFQCN